MVVINVLFMCLGTLAKNIEEVGGSYIARNS